MNIEFYSIEKIKKEIMDIISKYLDANLYNIFFFGSRVMRKNNPYSDIDIGIEGPDKIPFETMFHIKEDIENLSTLYKIDIVDFKRIPSDFKDEALKYTETIKT